MAVDKITNPQAITGGAYTPTGITENAFSSVYFNERKSGNVVSLYIEATISTSNEGWIRLGITRNLPKSTVYAAGQFFENGNRANIRVFDVTIDTDGSVRVFAFAGSNGLKIRQTFVFFA